MLDPARFWDPRHGQQIALVVATSYRAAKKGADAVKVGSDKDISAAAQSSEVNFVGSRESCDPSF